MRAYVCFLDVVPRDFDGFDANHGEGETDELASVVPSSNAELEAKRQNLDVFCIDNQTTI